MGETSIILVLFGGLVFAVAIGLISARLAAARAERLLGRTMRAASTIVAEGLAAYGSDEALGAITRSLADLFDATACVIAMPTGDGRLRVASAHGYPDAEELFIKEDEGMTGKVYTSGTPLVASDVTKEPSYHAQLGDIRSAIVAPIRFEGQVLGSFDLESRDRVFTERDLAVVVPLADQIGAVISALRLRRASEERAAVERELRRTLQAISAVVMAGVASVDDFERSLESMLNEIRTRLHWESMAVVLLDDDGRLRNRVFYGYPAVVQDAVLEPGEGIVGRVVATGVGRLVDEVAEDPDYKEFDSDTRSEMCVPLKTGGKVLGALNVESPRPAAFTTHEFRLLEMLSEQMAVVLERARLTDLERAAMESLRHLDQLKDDFLATVSHELRTPLTSIKGSAQTILVRDDALDPADRRAFLEVIVRQCDRLAGIVETLLLVSRLESGDVGGKVAYILLGDLVGDALEATGTADRVDVDVEAVKGFVADQFRVHHILRNLIENACKYSPDDSPVWVRAYSKEGCVHIEVMDQGEGIPAGMEEDIFGRFQRLPQPGRARTPGTGLGLYIARRFARDLGGDVVVGRAEEPPYTGACFVLTIPDTQVDGEG